MADVESTLKENVRSFWNSQPNGTQFTGLEWGSREFFDDIESFRYRIQPFMRNLVGFDRYRGKTLLEVGCGLGTDLLQFARGGAIVTGVDLTPQSVELARKRFDLYGVPAILQVADAERLPFADNIFDVGYSFGVLHHTPDTQRSVDELCRVVKPGGEVVVMLYHKNSLHVWLGAVVSWIARYKVQTGLTRVEDWIRRYDGDANPLGKAYTRGQLRAMFAVLTNITFQTVDPYRRHWPKLANTINQLFFARWCGFYIVIRGRKP